MSVSDLMQVSLAAVGLSRDTRKQSDDSLDEVSRRFIRWCEGHGIEVAWNVSAFVTGIDGPLVGSCATKESALDLMKQWRKDGIFYEEVLYPVEDAWISPKMKKYLAYDCFVLDCPCCREAQTGYADQRNVQ